MLGELRLSWYALRPGRPALSAAAGGADDRAGSGTPFALCLADARGPRRAARPPVPAAGGGAVSRSMDDERGPGLVVTLPLAEPGDAVRVLVTAEGGALLPGARRRTAGGRSSTTTAWTAAFTCCSRSWRPELSESRFRLAAGVALSLVPQEGELSMDFRPLNDTERRQLINALRGNAESDRAILMDRRDTSFAGTTDEVTDEEVIIAIKSVPCHY